MLWSLWGLELLKLYSVQWVGSVAYGNGSAVTGCRGTKIETFLAGSFAGTVASWCFMLLA
jgi:hypothetical protein